MKTKWVPKVPKSPSPLTADKVVQMDNVIKGMNKPKELLSLKSANSITIRDSAGNLKPADFLNKIDLQNEEINAWNVNGQNIVRGLPGKEAGRLSHSEVKKAGKNGNATKAHNPVWSDIIYSPKISPGLIRPTMRRLNGRRVKPNYVFGNDDRQPFYPSGYP